MVVNWEIAEYLTAPLSSNRWYFNRRF